MRCDRCTIISFFIPEVSGSRFIRVTSKPARQAAVASVSAAEAPLVTRPASAPVASAIMRLAASWSWSMRTQESPASRMASITSGGSAPPPTLVLKLRALITRCTPSLS